MLMPTGTMADWPAPGLWEEPAMADGCGVLLLAQRPSI